MSDTIEIAKSGRAACRTCKKNIAKDELRFGEEFANQFSSDGGASYRWHHMECAADKLPHRLKDAMDAYVGEIANRDELEKRISEAASKQKGKSDAFPYADIAPTGRAKCIQCREPIEKGSARVAIERELDTGGMVTKGAGYMHPGCVASYLEKLGDEAPPIEDFTESVKKHTTGLGAEELDKVIEQF